MSNMVKVILTYNNPTKYEFVQLLNTIYLGTSLSAQQIYISSLSTNLLHYSNSRLENIKLLHELTIKELSPELLILYKKDYEKFKIEYDVFNKQLK